MWYNHKHQKSGLKLEIIPKTLKIKDFGNRDTPALFLQVS
jgi:hypothetical protein